MTNWIGYFTAGEDAFYREVSIASVKRDALTESVRDVCFLDAIRHCMRQVCGDDLLAIPFTVRAIIELVELGFIEIHPSEDSGITITAPLDTQTVENWFRSETGLFYVIAPTSKGRRWVERFHELHAEFDA